MNRISTSQLYSNTLLSIAQRQNRLADLQSAIASGKNVRSGADDPVGAGRLVELNALTTRLLQYERNGDSATSRLVATENALSSTADAINRVRELAIASVNGINNAESLSYYGGEILAQLDQVIGLANQSDANGEYIFSGTASSTIPFTLSGSASYSYFGNDQIRRISVSDNQVVETGIPGTRVFAEIPTGNGRFQVVDGAANAGTMVAGDSAISAPGTWIPDNYTITFIDDENYEVRDSGATLITTGNYSDPGTISFLGADLSFVGTPAAGDTFAVESNVTQDIFTTINDLGQALTGSANLSDTARANLVNRSLANIDQALTANQNARARIGSQLNTIDAYRDLNARDLIQAQNLVSRIEDLDYAAAISEFEYESTILEAAQQTFLSFQNLSLFRLL